MDTSKDFGEVPTTNRNAGAKETLPSWFVAGMDRSKIREMAKNLKQYGQVGDFMIRDVATNPGCYGLALKTDDQKLTSYLIERDPIEGQFNFRGSAAGRRFRSIQELVKAHASQVLTPLPIALRVRGASSSKNNSVSEPIQEEDEPDEQSPMLKYVSDSDPLTATAQWFVPQVSSREIVEMIQNMKAYGQTGDFLIRERRSTKGYALSVKTEKSGILNYLIEEHFGDDGTIEFSLKGAKDTLFFKSISSMVYHYAVALTGICGTRLLLRDEDLAQFSKAYVAPNASGFGIDPITAKAKWFLISKDRNELLQILTKMQKESPAGDFIVRDVPTEPGCFGMSVKMENSEKMPNYLIERAQLNIQTSTNPQAKRFQGQINGASTLGFKLRGTSNTEVFSTLGMLVYYYATSAIGVMGQQLKLDENLLSELEEHLSEEYVNELSRVKTLAQTSVADILEDRRQTRASELAKQEQDKAEEEKAKLASPPSPSSPPPPTTTTPTTTTTPSPTTTTAPVTSDEFQQVLQQSEKIIANNHTTLMLLFNVTVITGDHVVLPKGSTLCIALHGDLGSTAMRPLPHDKQLLVSNSTCTLPVAMEDVGEVNKISMGIQSGSPALIDWSLVSISVKSSTGEVQKKICHLRFSKATGFYHECIFSSGKFDDDVFSPNAISLDPLTLSEKAKKLSMIRVSETFMQNMATTDEEALRRYRTESERMHAQLSHARTTDETLAYQRHTSNVTTNELSQRTSGLAVSMKQTQGEIAKKQRVLHEIETIINETRGRVALQKKSLYETGVDYNIARASTVQDQRVLEKLLAQKEALQRKVTKDEARMQKLVSKTQQVRQEIGDYSRSLQQTGDSVRALNQQLTTSSDAIKTCLKEERELETQMMTSTRRLEMLAFELDAAKGHQSSMNVHERTELAKQRALQRAKQQRRHRAKQRQRSHDNRTGSQEKYRSTQAENDTGASMDLLGQYAFVANTFEALVDESAAMEKESSEVVAARDRVREAIANLYLADVDKQLEQEYTPNDFGDLDCEHIRSSSSSRPSPSSSSSFLQPSPTRSSSKTVANTTPSHRSGSGSPKKLKKQVSFADPPKRTNVKFVEPPPPKRKNSSDDDDDDDDDDGDDDDDDKTTKFGFGSDSDNDSTAGSTSGPTGGSKGVTTDEDRAAEEEAMEYANRFNRLFDWAQHTTRAGATLKRKKLEVELDLELAQDGAVIDVANRRRTSMIRK